jgi:hypothetical protein
MKKLIFAALSALLLIDVGGCSGGSHGHGALGGSSGSVSNSGSIGVGNTGSIVGLATAQPFSATVKKKH